MPNKPKENIAILYKNPFDDYNANVLEPEMIMQYWCTPFTTGALKELDETKFYSERMPIVLQGSRGSGKTTILKYFSFPVQCNRATQNNISITQQIMNDTGVGFYLRCDEGFLKMFKTVLKATVGDAWTECFNHYLELFFTKNIVNLIQLIHYSDYISDDILLDELKLNEFIDSIEINTLKELDEYIDSELRYLNKFKNEALFTGAKFNPKNIFDFYQLSGRLISIIKTYIHPLHDINFLLLLDEFENLPLELQKLINNLIKFCKSGMSMRIGRRSENENIVTKETINAEEYLREGNDYRLIKLDYQSQDINDIRPYLQGIAQKRLSAFEDINLPTNIIEILGDKEDLDTECTNIANSKNSHMEYILKSNSDLSNDDSLRSEVIRIISYPENRIAEALNALWVARCTNDYLENAQDTIAAMHSFFCKTTHPKREKYKSDYENKYRYALTIVICTAYRKDKLYYGFNTICYLSEGNARTFINICKAIISNAMFYEKNDFIENGKVSIKHQHKAIKDYAISEFNSVCSIINCGKEIKNFILQIGNVFSDYHKDKFVRYPETNQFTYVPEELSLENRKTLDIAESWALIHQKDPTQRLSAGIEAKGYLYTINRVFSPIFNISYRTRGGVNVVLSADDIRSMMDGHKVKKLDDNTNKKHKTHSTSKPQVSTNEQLTLFDVIEDGSMDE